MKYFKYALGEVILVVIGILLAFAINSWNEERKEVHRQVKTLEDLKDDLQMNVINTKQGLHYIKLFENCSLALMDIIDNDASYETHMDTIFGQFHNVWDPDFSNGAYENLKSQGVNLVSNDSLKRNIVDIFEVQTDILDESRINRQYHYNISVVLPMITKYFKKNPEQRGFNLHPTDYEAMLADQQFYNMCSILASTNHANARTYRRFIEKAEQLMVDISDEIKELKQ